MIKITVDRSQLEQWLQVLVKIRCDALYEQDCNVCNTEEAIRAALADPQEPDPADSSIVVESRDGALYLDGKEIDPGTIELSADGYTYRSAVKVDVRPAEPDTDSVHESIRWQLCLLAQTEEFSDEVRKQIGRGVWLIEKLRAALAEPVQCADNDSPWLICKPCAAEGVCKKAEPVQDPVAWECKAGGLRRLTRRQYEAQPDNIKRHYTRIEHCLWARNGNEPCPHVQQAEPVQELDNGGKTAELTRPPSRPVAWTERDKGDPPRRVELSE